VYNAWSVFFLRWGIHENNFSESIAADEAGQSTTGFRVKPGMTFCAFVSKTDKRYF
jgi:hypothetical protein